MSPEDFSQRMHKEVLGALWCQWSALGVAGVSGNLPAGLILDPEALLLATFYFGRRDPRLFDEVLDWLTVNGDLVNVSRLRRMVELRGVVGGERVFRAVSSVVSMEKRMSPQWSRLSPGQLKVHETAQGEVFFHDLNGVSLPAPRHPDPVFGREGFLREQVATRGMSSSFPRTGIASMLLRLRALIGNSSRCELLCLLATRSGLTGRQAAVITDYAARTVQIALSEMNRSGYVDSQRVGNELWYQLTPSARESLGLDAPASFPPASALVEALTKLTHATQQAISKSAKLSAITALVRSESQMLHNELAAAGFLGALGKSLAANKEDYFSTLWSDCEGLMFRWIDRESALPMMNEGGKMRRPA